MLGTLDQLISLVTYGNDYLATGCFYNPHDFYPEGPSFRACIVVDFRNIEKNVNSSELREDVVAYNPMDWFMMLEEEGCKKLRICYRANNEPSLPPDYKLAGLVGGGGDWYIESVHNNYSHYWASRWEVTSPDNPDGRSWSVHYGRTTDRYPISEGHVDVPTAKQHFIDTLTAIGDFAQNHKLKNWEDIFRRARLLLTSTEFDGRYAYMEVMPGSNYSEDALRLLAATGTAWVFGGMGSWNDLGFSSDEDQNLYLRLSDELYNCITKALIAAVNSF